jgi:octaprenyl-diphosphate synthase
MTIKEISEPIEKHIDEFNDFLKGIMNTKVSLLNLIIRYMTKKRGKQIRPMLVFLAAELCGGVTKRTYTGAAMVELLHNATLVHDDVVDESTVRRGIASINAAWNNKIAVLIGDYLLAKGLLASIDMDEFEFLKITSHSVRRMSEGELLQIQKSREADTLEDTYFKIISDKTASLISACCEIGAASATDNTSKKEAMREYGENIGIAFQIKDDIFDYTGKDSVIGKPVGNDIKEKKLTLPLIYSCNKAPQKDAKKIIKLVKNGAHTKKDIKTIVEFVHQYDGINYAEIQARKYIDNALACLEIFNDSPAKESFINLARFVVERNI